MKKKSGSTTAAPQEMLSVAEITDHLMDSAAALIDTDPTQAEEILLKALQLTRNSKSAAGTGKCLSLLATLYFKKGAFKEKLSILKDAADAYLEAGLLSDVASSYTRISSVYAELGQFQQAISTLGTALEFARKDSNLVAQGDILNRTGELQQVIGKYDDSIASHLKAMEIFEMTGDHQMLAETYCLLGECYLRRSENDSAFSFLEKALKFSEIEKKPALMARAGGGLARVFGNLKEFTNSNSYYNTAIQNARQSDDTLLLATLLKDSGKSHLEAGQQDIAATQLEEALVLAENGGLQYLLPEIHHGIAEIHARSGTYTKAYEHLMACLRVAEELKSKDLKTLELALESDPTIQAPVVPDEKPKTPVQDDQFLLHVGHEVRTPLNGVLGMADLLLETQPDPEQLEYINTIRLSAGNLLTFVDEVFEYQQLFAPGINTKSEPVHIRAITDDLFPKIQEWAKAGSVRFTLKTEPDVPDEFTGDGYITRTLTEKMISHGIRSSPGGQVSCTISLTGSAKNETHLQISVSASGFHFQTDELKWLQGNSTTAPENTLAIPHVGLSIIKKLTSLLGGSISTETLPGPAIAISVSLPLRGIAQQRNFQSWMSPSQQTALLEVLLVEDNKVNQFLAQKLLTKMGFSVSLASNASEAVDALQRETFDVILMDVQMPVMSGYELTELIRTTLPPPVNTIPIIALTAYASPQEREKALACGMNAFVTKPYSPEELKNVLLRVTEKARSAGEEGLETDILPEEIASTVARLQVLFSGNVEDVVSLLNMLIVQIPQLLREAGQNIDNRDWSGCFQSFHKIRSSINLLKIRSLSNAIAELEEFSKDSIHADRIPALYGRFSKSCEKAVGFLKEEVIKLKQN